MYLNKLLHQGVHIFHAYLNADDLAHNFEAFFVTIVFVTVFQE